LEVGGISTLGSASTITGFTTVTSDLYVGGNLYVKEDIFKDEITGRNMLITGIGTVNELYVNTGFATNFTVENFEAFVGVITEFSSDRAGIASANIDDLIVGVSTFTGITTFQNKVFTNSDIESTANILAQDITAKGNVRGNVGLFTDTTISNNLTVNGQTSLETLNVSSGSTFTGPINASSITAGLGTITTLESSSITSSGIITGVNVYASGVLEAKTTLNSKGTLTVDGEAVFNNQVILGAGSTLTLQDGDVRILSGGLYADFADLNYLDVGIAFTGVQGKFTTLEISSRFDSLGVSSFRGPVNMEQSLTVDGTVTANSGILSTLNVDDKLTAKDGRFNGLLDLTNANASGIITTTNLKVNGELEANVVEVITGIVTNLTAVTADVATLNVNAGFATEFTVSDKFVSSGEATFSGNINAAGISTITDARITNGIVSGILTVGQQIDHTLNATSTDGAKVTTSAVSAGQLLYGVPSGYTSAEFTITAVEGTNFHTTKIHALNTGSDVLFNEYSNIFNNDEVGQYEVVSSAGGMNLQVEPASANLTTYTIHIIAHKA